MLQYTEIAYLQFRASAPKEAALRSWFWKRVWTYINLWVLSQSLWLNELLVAVILMVQHKTLRYVWGADDELEENLPNARCFKIHKHVKNGVPADWPFTICFCQCLLHSQERGQRRGWWIRLWVRCGSLLATGTPKGSGHPIMRC